MSIKKAEIKDLPLVVKLKMDMFREVGSIHLLQDGAEENIRETYARLYREGKCCHYLLYEGMRRCDWRSGHQRGCAVLLLQNTVLWLCD